MALFSIKNISVKGISACVPKTIEKIKDISFFSQDEVVKFSSSTGIEERRISDNMTTTSDLCLVAAEQLISDLSWNKEDIDYLIFVTQTPDYILPTTSCIIQNKLGLNEEVCAFDISLGCSGWIYGISTLSQLISASGLKRGLLLAGDTISKISSREDKSVYPLFGDAGTATALEFDSAVSPLYFHLATNGDGYDTIIIPEGGCRYPYSKDSLIMKTEEDNIRRKPIDIALNGMDVFSFGITKAPQSVNKLLTYASYEKENINYYLFHQANLYMNEKIRKKIKIEQGKVPYSLKKFGNTSSATIPLTMVTQMQQQLQNEKLNIVACGFGVGLSWGSALIETNKIICSNLIEI